MTSLSEQQKALRLRIYQSGQSADRTELRREHNHILRCIHKHLLDLDIQQADSLVDDITATDDCRMMFLEVQAMNFTGAPPTLPVHNQDAGTDQGKADLTIEWFEKQFTDAEDEPLHAFTGAPRQLHTPVKAREMEKALKALKNGRASGPDGMNNELFKYASNSIAGPIALIINSAFEPHLPIDAFGQGTPIALQKPKKPPGPPANICPIALLNSVWKIISNVTLCHIRDKIYQFTGPCQTGCADINIIWTPKHAGLCGHDKTLGLPQDGHRHVMGVGHYQSWKDP